VVTGILTLSFLVSLFELGASFGLFARPFARPSIVVGQYYTAVMHQNYAQAYTYLDAQATRVGSLTTFTHAAQALDAAAGTVTSFTLAADFPTNPQAVTAQVHRAKGVSYAVHLEVRQVGSQWKIVSFDRL
jgi:hypothetical protein